LNLIKTYRRFHYKISSLEQHEIIRPGKKLAYRMAVIKLAFNHIRSGNFSIEVI